MSQLSLFTALVSTAGVLPDTFSVATDERVAGLLSGNAPVAIGISGGKDSSACAWAVCRHLDKINHTGPRLLVHADLGEIEWADSARICEQLAYQLDVDLITVTRAKGGMIERWQSRWEANVARYKALSCVSLILPWSTPAMRFCTSELKTSVICQALTSRFAGQAIVSVSGVRRAESKQRRNTPISSVQDNLIRKRIATTGIDWNPLVDWSLPRVWAAHKKGELPIHEAYRTYGCSRVSCSFCIMSARDDLAGALSARHNHGAYRQLVDLENKAAFSFQSDTWLGSLAPQLLSETQQQAHWSARYLARQRETVNNLIPARVRFVKGWPTAMITAADARLLADVRSQTAALYQWTDMDCISAERIRDRYAELVEKKAQTKKKRSA